MSIFTLILRNLKYYRKPYLAILAGTVISTAVLTGALVVGDSVRYSLVQLTDVRLGQTRFAIESGERLFRQQLANDLTKHTKSLVAPVLQLEGIALNTDKNTQLNRLQVLGVDERFVHLWNDTTRQPAQDEAILSLNTAQKLNLHPGDEFLLKIHKPSNASENAPFVSEKEAVVAFRLKVSAIADDRQSGRFSLKTNQSAPFNVFISLESMNKRLRLQGKANLLLIAGNQNAVPDMYTVDSLLRLSWKAEDAGLGFKPSGDSNTIEIRSDRIFIPENAAKAIRESIPHAEPLLTYLVNSVSSGAKATPYSFVTAATANWLGHPLSHKQIIVSDWLAADLGVKPGDSLTLKYFKMGALRTLTEDSARFGIRMVLPITDPIFDHTLMPDFPGMSDAGNCREWETGSPVKLDKIRDKDEQYWNRYRGTPKAFITIADGQKIWDNAFGQATAFRFTAGKNGQSSAETSLMSRLVPAENGLLIKEVYSEGKSAAANSTDFGGLFLSLSFFIIVAALLLTALLFSLHAQKRMAETAILATLGFRKMEIIRILFMEASLVILAGGLLGVISGVFYTSLLLLGLNTLWQDAVRTSMLHMQLLPATLVLGFAAGVITAMISLLFVLIRNLRQPLTAMVKNAANPGFTSNRVSINISLATGLLFLFMALAIITYSFLARQADPSEAFLSAGGMILVSGMTFLNALLFKACEKSSIAFPGFYTMILKNIALNRRRTLTAVALLALGTFSVIITGANRKTFYGSENSRSSGTGGFLFWAESTVSLLYDLNSPEGKEKYGLSEETSLEGTRFLQMLRLEGNDASCLNLNQVSQPALLGIDPVYFDRQQSFSFMKLDPAVNEKHPWLTLNTASAMGVIPGIADQTVIQWGLHRQVGDTLLYRDESGKTLRVRLIAGLDNSVFQGNVLVSAALFRQYFPSVSGSKVMLIDGQYAKRNEISQKLEFLFQDYGMVVSPASERLAQFNSVENTYLSVFMLLGGLGILIGTVGLGIVLLRNLEERKQEIALYQAIGFEHSYILKLIFTENLFILLSGIGTGLMAAFAGILPSFFSPAFRFPASFLLVILILILLSGMAWIYFPVKSALRKNLVEALRKE